MAAQRLARQTPELIMDTLEEILSRLSCAVHSARNVCPCSGAHADGVGALEAGVGALGESATLHPPSRAAL